MRDYDQQDFRRFTMKSEFDKSIHSLEGIIKGITLGRMINQDEINELINWCQLNSIYVDRPPFNELIDLVKRCLEDNTLTYEEIQDILWVCNNYQSGSVYYDVVTSDMQVLQGILHGILADNEINENEIYQLKEWMENTNSLANTYPYD